MVSSICWCPSSTCSIHCCLLCFSFNFHCTQAVWESLMVCELPCYAIKKRYKFLHVSIIKACLFLFPFADKGVTRLNQIKYSVSLTCSGVPHSPLWQKNLNKKKKEEQTSHCNNRNVKSVREMHQSPHVPSPAKDVVACGVKAWSWMCRINTLFWFMHCLCLLISCTKKNPVQQRELCDVWYVEQTAAGSINSPLWFFFYGIFFPRRL